MSEDDGFAAQHGEFCKRLRMKATKLALLFILFHQVADATQEVSFQPGQNFIEARRQLLDSGWTPIPGNKAPAPGLWKDLRVKGFREVDFCTQGNSYCSFFYRKNGKCLEIGTQGEEIAALRLTGKRNRCPGR